MLRRLALTATLAATSLALFAVTAGAATIYVPGYGTGPPEVTYAYNVAADGSISPLAGSPFPMVPGATPPATGIIGLAFTPDGGHAATTYLFKGGIMPLTVAADGSMAPASAPTLTPSVQGLAVSPDGRFAYAPTRDFMMVSAVGLLGYAIGSDGTLAPLSASPFGSGQFGDVAITPDGRFLFAASGTQIQPFSIGADGNLTPLTPVPFLVQRTMKVSPDGRFLFAGRGDGVVSFAIGGDGSLTQRGSPALTGAVALQLFAVAADGGHIYMPDSNADAIVTAAIGPDGSPTVVGSTPLDDPDAVELSPDGRFLYWARRSPAAEIGVAAIGANGVPALLPGTAPWDSGEGERILVRPRPTPIARLSVTPGFVGNASSFDARGSVRAAHFDWDFGDGSTLADGGPTPQHAYAKLGTYNVRLTLSDAQGCSTRQIYTGQSTSCPGGASATLTVPVNVRRDPPPVLGKLSITNRRFAVAALLGSAAKPKVKRGTSFRYTLSEAATARFTIERSATGRRVGKKCRPQTRANAGHKKCVRFKRIGAFSRAAKAGRNTTKFSGKLGRRKLKPGSYRATAIATDSAGGKSKAKRVAFRTVRP